MVAALQLLIYVLLDAVLQGRLTLRNRQYVPPSEQKGINLDLHVLSPALYALYTYAVADLDWRLWLLALALRLGLFDPVLNLVKGDPLFAVGSSALTDKLLQKLAGARASWLSGAVRLAAVAAAALLLSSCRGSDTTRTQPGQPVSTGPVAVGGAVPDSLAIKERTPKETERKPGSTGIFGLFGRRKPERNTKEKAAKPAKRAKYKNVTFTTVVGNDNQVQQTGKKAQAPVGQAAPAASLNQADSKTGVAQAGENLQAEQKQAEVKPWYGFLLGPVGIALAVVLVAGVGYGFWQYKRARSIV